MYFAIFLIIYYHWPKRVQSWIHADDDTEIILDGSDKGFV